MNLKTPKAQKQLWGRLCGTRIEGGVLLREESVCTVELWKGESDEEGKGGFGCWRVRASSSLYRGCRGERQQPGEMVVVGGRRRRGRNQRRRSVLRSVQGEGRRGRASYSCFLIWKRREGRGRVRACVLEAATGCACGVGFTVVQKCNWVCIKHVELFDEI